MLSLLFSSLPDAALFMGLDSGDDLLSVALADTAGHTNGFVDGVVLVLDVAAGTALVEPDISCKNTGAGNTGSPDGFLPVPDGPPLPVTIVWFEFGVGRSLLWPACISSLVNMSSSSPISCRYTQSGLLQGMLRIKLLQYFVVLREER